MPIDPNTGNPMSERDITKYGASIVRAAVDWADPAKLMRAGFLQIDVEPREHLLDGDRCFQFLKVDAHDFTSMEKSTPRYILSEGG